LRREFALVERVLEATPAVDKLLVVSTAEFRERQAKVAGALAERGLELLSRRLGRLALSSPQRDLERVEKALRVARRADGGGFVIGVTDQARDRRHGPLDGSVTGEGRLVLLPVGAWDLRATVALQVARAMPAEERRALHVASAAGGWTTLGAHWQGESVSLPLQVIDAEGRSVADTVAAVVADELMRFCEIAVIVGRLDVTRWRHRLLHDRTADDICRRLADMSHTTVSCVNVGTV